MSPAPLQVCAKPGCPVAVARGYCPAHQPTRLEQRQPTDPRYGTQRWRRYSTERRLRHPFCALCRAFVAGQTHGRADGVTDHIVPVTEAPDKFWDEANHRTLCHRCNGQERGRRASR